VTSITEEHSGSHRPSCPR